MEALAPLRWLHLPPHDVQYNDGQNDQYPFEIFPQGIVPPFPYPFPRFIIGFGPNAQAIRLPQRTELHAKEAIASAIRTSDASRTKITSVLSSIRPIERLRAIKVNPCLWEMLAHYAKGVNQQLYAAPPIRRRSNQPAQPVVLLEELNNMIFSAWQDHANYPSLVEQLHKIYSLRAWYQQHLLIDPALVNSEFAIQDDFARQFVMPLNMILKTRFGGPLCQRPGWTRFCEQDGVSVQQNHLTGVKAGYPDFLLHKSVQSVQAQPNPARREKRAFVEVKTWWSYPTAEFHEIYTRAALAGGHFMWNDGTSSTDVAIQLWAEVHRFEAPIGFWTNGRVAAIVMKTDDQELTFSYTRDWSDPEVYLGLIGLSFMVGQADENVEGSTMQDMINRFCPDNLRRIPHMNDLRVVHERD